MRAMGKRVNFFVEFAYYYLRALKRICFHCGNNLWPPIEVTSTRLSTSHILLPALSPFLKSIEEQLLRSSSDQENKVIWEHLSNDFVAIKEL